MDCVFPLTRVCAIGNTGCSQSYQRGGATLEKTQAILLTQVYEQPKNPVTVRQQLEMQAAAFEAAKQSEFLDL
jgi:hypothetical protein